MSEKIISSESFLVDINMVEAPLFTFKQSNKLYTVEHWLNSNDMSNEAKTLLKEVQHKDVTTMEYMRWTDSKGDDREIVALSVRKLPNGFAMDVLYSLIALFIRKSPPILFDEEKGEYILESNVLNCSITEICQYMGVSDGGAMTNKIKEAIRQLYAVNYHSLAKGVIYDGNEKCYVNREIGVNLLTYEFISKDKLGKSKYAQPIVIKFGEILMNNIKNSFIKFLSNDTYFSLKSGLTRRLYAYIGGNKFISKNCPKVYIKRNFSTLKYKLPIDYRRNYDLKRKLKNPLDSLIESGVINGYFYGDEIHINGVKEDCIYIYFKGTQHELIKSLTKTPIPKKSVTDKKLEELQEDVKLVYPKDIKAELIAIGIDEDKIFEIMKKYSKYKLAELILWIKEIKKVQNKIVNEAGMFIFALEKVNVRKTHAYISDFIEEYKAKELGDRVIKANEIEEAYEKFLSDESNRLKEEATFQYEILVNSVVEDLNKSIDNIIKRATTTYNLLLNNNAQEKDIEKASIDLEMKKAYKIAKNKETTELFKRELNKQLVLVFGLTMFEDFKIQYINKKNKNID